MPRDRETPQTGMGERRGPLKLGGDPTGKEVPCRQCGSSVELTTTVLEVWAACNRRLARAGEQPLNRDELLVCARAECKHAEADEASRRAVRENNETQAIIDAIKRGEAVSVPSEIVQYRPSCYARIRGALQARRDGRLPTLDAEID